MTQLAFIAICFILVAPQAIAADLDDVLKAIFNGHANASSEPTEGYADEDGTEWLVVDHSDDGEPSYMTRSDYEASQELLANPEPEGEPDPVTPGTEVFYAPDENGVWHQVVAGNPERDQ